MIWRIFPFRIGARGPLLLRREQFHWGLEQPMRLLYFSDLHLGHWWTRGIPAQLIDSAKQARPHLILLGGDLVDRYRALPLLKECLRELLHVAPTFAIPGNHDERVGITSVRQAVQDAGASWLPDEPILDQVTISAQITSEDSSSRPRVLCAHAPDVFPSAVEAGYQLVLAGHLHGGQCVFATVNDRLYPAVWFHRWHVLRASIGQSTLLVSRGVADTLPIRFNCPREAILCEIS